MRSAVALLVLVASSAHAAPARLEVVGDACPAALVRERVRAVVGVDPFVDAAPVTVEAELAPDGDAVRATLVIRDGDDVRGTRALAAPGCEPLADQLALAIAMVLRDGGAPAAPTPAVPDADEPPSPAESRAAERARDGRAPVWRPRFVMIGGAEVADGSVFGGLFGGRVRVGAVLSVGLELALRADETVELGTGMAHVGRGGGTVAGCGHAGPLALCATTTVGWWHGRGDGLAMTRASITPLFAVGVRAAFEWPLARWLGVRLHGDVRGLLTRTRLTVDDATVWTSPTVETELGLAAVVPIP